LFFRKGFFPFPFLLGRCFLPALSRRLRPHFFLLLGHRSPNDFPSPPRSHAAARPLHGGASLSFFSGPPCFPPSPFLFHPHLRDLLRCYGRFFFLPRFRLPPLWHPAFFITIPPPLSRLVNGLFLQGLRPLLPQSHRLKLFP